MEIYGHFASAPANQVRLAVSALGVDATYHHVDLQAGEQKSPDYLAINPFGKVPALVDGDFKLAESNAICRYLGSKVGGAMYPADLHEQAKIDQWMEFAVNHIRTNMSKILFNRMFAPMMGLPVDEDSVKEGQDFLDQYLPMVEGQLADSAFITGDQMTLADIALIAAMEPFDAVQIGLEAYPQITRWRSGIMAQPFYQQVHAHYGAEMEG
ncbi:MAG: glutathione S-transferase family protein [Pseudomonadota bacterium]